MSLSDEFLSNEEEEIFENNNEESIMVTESKKTISSKKKNKPQKRASSSLPPLRNSSKKTINFLDPLVIEAMNNLGYVENDFLYPTEADLSLYTRDIEFRSKVKQKLYDEVDHRINQLNEEMENIKNKENENFHSINKKLSRSPNKNKTSMLEIEEERFIRAEERNKKEVEQLILMALTKKYQIEEINKRTELEEQKKKEIEEKLKEKRKLDKQKQMEKNKQLEL